MAERTPQVPPKPVTPQIIQSYRESREKWGLSHEQTMWLHSILLSLYVYVVVAFYTSGITGFLVSRQVNISIGYVGLIFLLLSMGMSSICYFWNFADRYLAYRKYFGILGFVYSLIHFVISFTLIQVRTGFGLFLQDPSNTLPFFTGLSSLLILLTLTVLSHRIPMRWLGKWWRRIMRFGYLALILAVLHTAARQGGEWIGWITFQREYVLPPFGLLMFIATCVVLLLRALMWYGVVHKKVVPSNALPEEQSILNAHATPLKASMKK